MINPSNKTSAYPTNSYETYTPTPMSSSQQYITSEFSNTVSPTNSSSLIMNENTMPVDHVEQTGISLFSKILFFVIVNLKIIQINDET